jgi:hypothetical protein
VRRLTELLTVKVCEKGTRAMTRHRGCAECEARACNTCGRARGLEGNFRDTTNKRHTATQLEKGTI